jgi:hypothetical protein
MMVYGYVLEKLGRAEEAKPFYSAAGLIFEITTFVGDDEALGWEREECERALGRVSSADGKGMPSLLEEVGGMRLEVRLSSYYRVHYPGYLGRKEKWPRYRLGKDGYEAMYLGG